MPKYGFVGNLKTFNDNNVLEKQATEILKRLASAIDETTTQALLLYQNSTPVQTGNLQRGWYRIPYPLSVNIKTSIAMWVIGNNAKSYDVGGAGEEYAIAVELGIASSTRLPRKAGPAYMMTKNLLAVAEMLKINVIKRLQ